MLTNGALKPHHKEAEQSVLGCVLRDNKLLFEVTRVLGKDDFYTFAHRCIFDALVELIAVQDRPADPVTLGEYISGKKQVDDIGGLQYIVDLWNATPVITSVLHYCHIVRERSIHRKLIYTFEDYHKAALAPGTKPLALLDKARAEFLKMAEVEHVQAADKEAEEDESMWQPFPTGLLPPVLSEYIDAAAESLMQDAGMMVLPVLCTVAGIIGNRFITTVKDDWPEPCIFWGATVARASSKKTPTFKHATMPLRQLQKDLNTFFHEETIRFNEEAAEYKEAMKAATTAEERKDLGKPPKKPIKERVLIGDITIEKLLELHDDNPAGLVMAMDELAGFLGSFQRYRAAGGGTDRPMWLSMFNGNEISYDRKSGDKASIFIPHACVNLFGMIQPQILAQLFSEDSFHSGLASRFLLMYPPKLPHKWTDAVIPHEVKAAYTKLCTTLYESYLESVKRFDWQPRTVAFTASALETFKTFYDEWGMVQDAASGPEEYAFGKLEGYCPRFALLLSLIEAAVDGSNPTIEETHVERAAALVRWFGREAVRVYEVLKSGGEQSQENTLLEWVRMKGGRVTPRDLQRSKFGRDLKAAECASRLDTLVKLGKAKWESIPSKEEGGRPSMQLVLS